jgi:NAD(P)-dependent dehydrogenase (short-subunit alcohol dehydrogenase family)
MKGRHVIVTGGLGFIGSHLVDKLVEDNDVAIIDNRSTGKLKNVSHLISDNLKVIERDIRTLNLATIFEGLDLPKIGDAMRTAIIVGGRRVFDSDAIRQLGFFNKGVVVNYAMNCAIHIDAIDQACNEVVRHNGDLCKAYESHRLSDAYETYLFSQCSQAQSTLEWRVPEIR